MIKSILRHQFFINNNSNKMKKALLASASLFLSVAAMAQLPVSTTPSNKNVILEEFTGIHCVYCPDGHKRAEQIRSANPNDVFLVNIHTGGYATPQAGEPDFRTAYGTALAGQSGLTGYPSGTVNRHVFSGSSTAMGRGDWAAASGTILGQASYVNVALEADIDVATRVMTVDLEAYFTANGASSMNINVVVTQNNVEGPQTGGSTYNPGNVLPNGNYNHGHMLRHMITGQWGDVITNTTMGSTITKQYMWTIPMDINGVSVEIGDLQVIGFIVEGQQEIITGAEGPISFTVPAGTILVDLETANQMSPPSDLCATSITPKVYITNNETATCSGYEISYSIDGGAPVVETVTTALAGGSSVSHTFQPATISGGAHSISYDIALTNSSELEIATGNNKSDSPTFLTIDTSPIGNMFTEDFESYADGEEIWDNTAMIGNSDFFVINETMFNGIPNALGGYAASKNSFRHRLYNMNSGDVNEIITYKLDFSNTVFSRLKFDFACAGLNDNFTDKFEVFISTDCGANWTSVYSKAGNDLATGPSNSQATFYPSATQWKTDSVDLNAYSETAEVMVKFAIFGSGDGNCFYLDNIDVSGSPLAVQELFNDANISIFPNPASSTATLKLTVDENQKVNIRIYDLSGRTIQYFNSALTLGNNMIDLETKGLTNGVYFVEVSSESKTTTRRLVIQK
jgi:hypothetical protein